jgi:hypothetical protein
MILTVLFSLDVVSVKLEALAPTKQIMSAPGSSAINASE